MKIPTIKQQTGWKRPMPMSICQDIHVLQSISEYSYDLNNQAFREFFTSRTGYSFIGGDKDCPKDITALIIEQDAWSDEEFLNTDELRYTNGQIIPADERVRLLVARKITKGKYQDCWELYVQQCRATQLRLAA